MRRFVVLLVLSLTLAGCGFAGSEVHEIGLVYSGGVVEDKVYQGILEPGATAHSVGMGSEVYRYRIDQRSWTADFKGKTRDIGPAECVSKDGLRLTVPYQMFFTLNWGDEDLLKRFHENIGVKHDAWTPEGWKRMLHEIVAPQIDRALDLTCLKHDARQVRENEESRLALAQETLKEARRNIQDVVGGDYFCGPGFNGTNECGDFTMTISAPGVPKKLVEAIESEQTAAAQTVAQEQENARIRAQLEVERELVELYGAQGALLRDAIDQGKINFMVIPQGSEVAVPVPSND